MIPCMRLHGDYDLSLLELHARESPQDHQGFPCAQEDPFAAFPICDSALHALPRSEEVGPQASIDADEDTEILAAIAASLADTCMTATAMDINGSSHLSDEEPATETGSTGGAAGAGATAAVAASLPDALDDDLDVEMELALAMSLIEDRAAVEERATTATGISSGIDEIELACAMSLIEDTAAAEEEAIATPGYRGNSNGNADIRPSATSSSGNADTKPVATPSGGNPFNHPTRRWMRHRGPAE